MPPAAARRARVVVVGAGPAGLEAACRAAELGHDVVLLEQADRARRRPARIAARTPPLARLRRLVAWYERRLAARRCRACARASRRRAASDRGALQPELVVVAVGARTEPPVLDGYDAAAGVDDRGHARRARPRRSARSPAPARPVVLGAGAQALAGALACARAGGDVTLLSRERPGFDASGLVRRAYLARLEREGVRRLRGRPLALTADGVRWTDDAGGGRRSSRPTGS